MAARTERGTLPLKTLVAALVLSGVGGTMILSGCAAHRSHHRPSGAPGGDPHVSLLLGIHRLAGVLLGDLALRTELDRIRLRVSDPLLLEPLPPRGDVLYPGSRKAHARMREILESAFVYRLSVLTASSPRGLAAPTHVLESSITELPSGVEIKFRLVSLADGAVAATAQSLVPGADLSLVSRGSDDWHDLVEPSSDQKPPDPAPLAREGPAEAPPPPRTEPLAPPPATAPPLDPLPSPPERRASSEEVPPWIYEILSKYSKSKGSGC